MNVFNFDTKVIAQGGEPSAETRTNSVELPRAFIAIDFAEDNRRLDRKIFKRKRSNFAASTHNPQDRAANHTEVLPTLIGVVNRSGQRNAFDVAGNFGKVNINGIVVVMCDTARIVAGVPVKDKVLIARNLTAFVRKESRRINLKRTRRAFKLYCQRTIAKRYFLPLAEFHRLTSNFYRDSNS